MSAVMTDQSMNNVAEFFTPGPGERLRAARLSMGYDLAKIASELHLTMAVVTALEADDYSDVGARVFVRGYLRNYARIVDMPVESILRQFDEKWPDDGARQTMVRQSPTLPADGGPSRGLAGAVTWLLVIGMVVLFLMWWRGYLDEIVPDNIRSGDSAPLLPAETGLMPGNGNALPGEFDPAVADSGLRLPPPPDVPFDARRAVPDEPAPAQAEQVAGDAVAEAAGGVGEGIAPSISLPSMSPMVLADPVPEAAPDEAAPGTPAVDGTRQIVMTFNAACWVDVRDSERRFKLFGEMPKGTRKVLGGQPPYKLVIGNAQAVTITVDGQPFDIVPFAKGNVARFTLDP